VSKTIEDARALIESRLAEIESEAEQLERAVASLGEGNRRRGRPSKHTAAARGDLAAAKPRRRRRRARRGQRQEELFAAIESMAGASPAELGDAIGIGSSQIHALIRKAEADGRVRKKGQGYALKA
jgi:hypothetical protein